jgi:hypothetical protein
MSFGAWLRRWKQNRMFGLIFVVPGLAAHVLAPCIASGEIDMHHFFVLHCLTVKEVLAK